ncbi:MAG: hypothetical protein U9Q15_02790 [Patescibacteria group bacterium]|nr:hypothetical protein [Patescibacteria group bacterium]
MYFSHKESATEKECLRQSTKFEDDNKVIDGEFIKEFLRDVDTDSDLK